MNDIDEAIEHVRNTCGDADGVLHEYAEVLANEVERLRELHRPRRTEDGEWPDEESHLSDYHMWDAPKGLWKPGIIQSNGDHIEFWLPAPPKPRGES